jgi:DNA-binding NarL/FixJ family response regulator
VNTRGVRVFAISLAAVTAALSVAGVTMAAAIPGYFPTYVAGHHVSGAFPELTDRERDVLKLLAHGARNRQIAEQLGIADKTVRNHLSAIFLKLQVNDRTAAALKARHAGLGLPDTTD